MYKVLIVDDELPARETLKKIIDWNQTQFEICGVARNGKEGIDMFETFRPDLIITDIQMPVMDGIRLIQMVKEVCVNQKFIILSCHEKFQYARAALKLGVEDYLLKDLLNPDDLYVLLNKISNDLDQDMQLSEVELGNEFDYQMDAFRFAAIKQLISESIKEDEIGNLITKIPLHLNSEAYVVMYYEFDHYSKSLSFAEIENLRIKNV